MTVAASTSSLARSLLRELLGALRRSLARPLTWAVIALLVGGALLRSWGLGFGLPYRYHIDEQGWVAYGGRLCSGEFEFPAWTAGPNFLHAVLCGGDILLFAGGLAAGKWGSLSAFRAAYEDDPSSVYLIGRALSVLWGSATALLVFQLGRVLWNQRVGLVAMAFMAFTYLHVRDSHFVVSDILVTFLLTACLILCARAIEGKETWAFAAAGLLAGLATGIKFTLVFAVLPVAASLVLSGEGRLASGSWLAPARRRQIAAVGLTFLLGFVLGYPNVFNALRGFQAFAVDFASEWRASHIRSDLWLIEDVPGWWFYARALAQGMGAPLAVLSLAGVVYGLYRRSRGALLLLSFVLPFYLFLGSQTYFTAHYMIPTLPGLVLLSALALDSLLSGVLAGRRSASLAAAVSLILVPSLVSIFRFDALVTREDTRTEAKRWIEANVPQGAKIAASLYASWEAPLSTAQIPQPDASRTYEVESVGGLGGISDVSFQDIEAQGFQYVLVSSYVYDIELRDPARRDARRRFFDALQREAELIYTIHPYVGDAPPPFEYDQIYGPWTWMADYVRPGPSLSVYRLP